MKTLYKITVLAALVALAVSPAMGQVEFTFEGFAMMTPGTDQVGASLTVYGIANPAISAPTPLPMDFDTYQYTVAVSGMTVTGYNQDVVNNRKTFQFEGGTIRLYSDMIAGGTAGDFALPGSFTDGDMFVEAAVDDGWELILNNPLGFGYTGAGIGTCALTGGSSLGDLQDLEFPLDGWTFAGTGVGEPSPFIQVPNGYDYIFGVKIIFPYDPTPNEDSTFGALKNLYR